MVTRALVLLLLASPLPAAAQAPVAAQPQAAERGGQNRAGPEAKLLPDQPAVTQHTLRIGNQLVAYSAEAGWLPIREDGKAVGRMFYIAYTKDGVQNRAEPPLVFSFNGGPDTASVWMHLGYTGPRRVVYDLLRYAR